MATKDYEVEACQLIFDGCAGEIQDTECVPDYTPEELEDCLNEHDLCTACAGDDEQLVACQDVFDACINPPPAP
jgi:hypothetical protein